MRMLCSNSEVHTGEASNLHKLFGIIASSKDEQIAYTKAVICSKVAGKRAGWAIRSKMLTIQRLSWPWLNREC